MPVPVQVLIINPNTSDSVSQLLHALAVRELGPEVAVRVQTARLGASYISDEVAYAIAGHGLLDAYAWDRAQPERPAPHAVLVGCFGDPGLLALRELCAAPVLGLAEASMRAAQARGRYAVVTGGQAWVPMLERLVLQLGLGEGLVSIQAVDKTGAQLAAEPELAAQELAERCLQVLAREPGLQTLLLGGAALGGLAEPVQRILVQRGAGTVQVLDSVRSSLQALAAAARHHAAAGAVRGGAPRPVPSVNLSAELSELLAPTVAARP